ncbi:fluoride efflux transporter CrcB [Coriobacteriia bacterium Es71-Z0120]|uniref:fluoride efflux transporter CrcB n=1 Tax=Parvivirga hydrogeniphila TaxID=2939460 RepID=UPI002260B72A|nr:fluoride efflux transporter CrcB [Parvivirga hydrogeniphila]MCL4078865.1 fluoride efflux transporter CrcB [Parvivirga hydrogeniphila]
MRASDVLIVAAGGAIGAAARYAVGGWLADRFGPMFPWHTFVINITGAFLLGMLVALSVERGIVPQAWRLALGVGVLGGYTTFSTLSYESVALLSDGAYALGLANMFGSGMAGLVAAWLGLAAGRVI